MKDGKLHARVNKGLQYTHGIFERDDERGEGRFQRPPAAAAVPLKPAINYHYQL